MVCTCPSADIPTQLANLDLTSLSLYNNKLNGTLPTWLGLLTDLTTLSLFQNSLSGPLPIQLGNLTKLARLSLGDNSLTGGAPSIATCSPTARGAGPAPCSHAQACQSSSANSSAWTHCD